MHGGGQTILRALLAAIDPATRAAIETAHFTQQLAELTAVLAAATVLSVFAAFILQWMNSRRDDRLRREDALAAESARREQYAHTQKMRDEEVERSTIEIVTKREASRLQIIQILSAYERYMKLLVAVPHRDVSAEAQTAQVLFRRAFSNEIAEAIEPRFRPQIYDALTKAQETLNSTLAHQRYHDEGMRALLSAQRRAAEFDNDLALATRIARVQSSQENWDRVELLKASPRAIDAAEYERTKELKARQLEDYYPVIVEDCESAAKALAESRRILGDTTPPHPGLIPQGQ